jgi:hypothetical protein
MYEAAISRGMALLDKRVPGWRERVNPAGLDMKDNDACLLGQLFRGGFPGGMAALGLHGEDAVRYGFDVRLSGDGFMTKLERNRLTQEWRAALSSTSLVSLN